MTLKEKLADDLKTAMKSGKTEQRLVLRMIRASIKNAEIKKGGVLDDAAVLEVLSREAKQRRESIAEFSKANRDEAVATEKAELAFIMSYLPRQMSREEIEGLTRQVIAQTGAESAKDKGKVMSVLMPQLKGKAEGSLTNEVVTQLLSEL